jgi:hypothetical protein
MASSVILLNNHVSNKTMFSQGDKMEAVAYGQQACRCNNELRIGEVYFFKKRGIPGFWTATNFRIGLTKRVLCRPACSD